MEKAQPLSAKRNKPSSILKCYNIACRFLCADNGQIVLPAANLSESRIDSCAVVLMVQWYHSLSEGHDLASFNEKHKEAINDFMSKKTTNSRALLDKMSIKLLENYDSLIPEERHVLKLNLSYVVDLIDGSEKIYKRYIKSDLFWKNLNTQLDNADSYKHSEVELVSRLNDLLKIFFSNTAIMTKIEETTSASTKQSRNSNEFNFSKSSSSNFFVSGSTSTSTSKSIAERKIDILIKSKDVELSCCEFKASASKSLTSYQRSKNLRLNQEIKESLKKVNVNTQVISLNWEGKYGYLFGLTEQNGVYVGYHLCNFVFPAAIKSVDHHFVSTLKHIALRKNFLVDLSAKALNGMMLPNQYEPEYPLTCHTPMYTPNQRQRTSE